MQDSFNRPPSGGSGVQRVGGGHPLEGKHVRIFWSGRVLESLMADRYFIGAVNAGWLEIQKLKESGEPVGTPIWIRDDIPAWIVIDGAEPLVS